jgi:PKD repeat protein
MSKTNHIFHILIISGIIFGSISNLSPFVHETQAQTSQAPELPRSFVDTTLPAVTGNSITVRAGDNFQTALNQAQPGDELVLEAGATFTGSFSLPAKTGEGWIIIRSSLSHNLVAGVRVGPNDAYAMPKLLAGSNNTPVIKTETAAHNYRFIGIEMSASAAVTGVGDLIKLGDSSAAQSTLESVPHHLTIDRCYIHGRTTLPMKRGVALNSAWTAVIDSHISDVHVVGQDTQALAGWNGPGPFKILNNYLEAAGENVMFGGADPKIANLLPSDIEMRRNHLFKPLSWKTTHPTYGGIHWTVKNLFELKLARRVLVEGNIFENCWTDGQIGYGLLIKTSNQDGTAPWSTTEDVTIVSNKILQAEVGIQVAWTSGTHPNQGVKRVRIANNLFDEINGIFVRLIDGPQYVIIDHNTSFQTGSVMTFGGNPAIGLVFTNNIAPHNTYGVKGDGLATGSATLNQYAPGCVFLKDALPGGQASQYPSGNFFMNALDDLGFMDRAGGNYRLSGSSPYRNAGTDGKDIGADIDAIEAAITGDDRAASNQPPLTVAQISVASGFAPLVVDFTPGAYDPDGQVVSYAWDFGDGEFSAEHSPTHTYLNPGTYVAQVVVTDNEGATASSNVTIVVTPAINQPEVTLLTPNNGETIQGASDYLITWRANGPRIRRTDLQLSLDNGVTWTKIVNGLSGQARSFLWRVPKTSSRTARVRVVSYSGKTTGSDVSDFAFTIVWNKAARKN